MNQSGMRVMVQNLVELYRAGDYGNLLTYRKTLRRELTTKEFNQVAERYKREAAPRVAS